MENKAIELAFGLIRTFEGLYLRPYLDPAGIPTIGYGTVYYPSGRRVRLDDQPCTAEDAKAYCLYRLVHDLTPQVLKACPNVDTEGRLAAFLDFAYNLGIGAFRASGVRRAGLQDRWELVPAEMLKWTHSRGRVLPGLVLRRNAEARLITGQADPSPLVPRLPDAQSRPPVRGLRYSESRLAS